MHESFETIDPERKKRILDAAFGEFARYGYKDASTNRIVAAAGIGKGPLFTYFGSKAGLFEYLLIFAGNFINQYLADIDTLTLETDIIRKYRLSSRFKFEMRLKEPRMFDFLAWIYLQRDEILKIEELKDIEQYIVNYESFRAELMLKFSKDSDISKLREDIESEKLIRYIGWAVDGYLNWLVNRLKTYPGLTDMSLEPFWKEFDGFVNDLEKIFYKPSPN